MVNALSISNTNQKLKIDRFCGYRHIKSIRRKKLLSLESEIK